MNTQKLSSKEVDTVIAALGECYHRLKSAKMTARELSQDGFNLMFKSAYQKLSRQH